MDSEYRHHQLTRRVIGVFYEVYNELGFGYLESVYQRSFMVALSEAGIRARSNAPVPVAFRGRNVGTYFADFLVEGVLIVELKACRAIEPAHESQLLNYLRGTSCEVGLLLNFGEKPAIRRLVFSNDRKPDRR